MLMLKEKKSAVKHAMIAMAGMVFASGPVLASSYDMGEILHDISAPAADGNIVEEFEGNPTFYQLTGQSAFLQSLQSSGSSGGQLDGASGFGFINFVEAFPPVDFEDYLTYAYFGVIELVGTNFSNDEVVLTQSVVVGFRDGAANDPVGQSFFDVFGLDLSVVLNKMTTEFDSAEFFALMNLINNNSDNQATTGLFNVTIDPNTMIGISEPVRSGEELRLIAFVGGGNSDLGVNVGRIDFTQSRITIIPEPTSALLLAGMGSMLLLRRRMA